MNKNLKRSMLIALATLIVGRGVSMPVYAGEDFVIKPTNPFDEKSSVRILNLISRKSGVVKFELGETSKITIPMDKGNNMIIEVTPESPFLEVFPKYDKERLCARIYNYFDELNWKNLLSCGGKTSSTDREVFFGPKTKFNDDACKYLKNLCGDFGFDIQKAPKDDDSGIIIHIRTKDEKNIIIALKHDSPFFDDYYKYNPEFCKIYRKVCTFYNSSKKQISEVEIKKRLSESETIKFGPDTKFDDTACKYLDTLCEDNGGFRVNVCKEGSIQISIHISGEKKKKGKKEKNIIINLNHNSPFFEDFYKYDPGFCSVYKNVCLAPTYLDAAGIDFKNMDISKLFLDDVTQPSTGSSSKSSVGDRLKPKKSSKPSGKIIKETDSCENEKRLSGSDNIESEPDAKCDETLDPKSKDEDDSKASNVKTKKDSKPLKPKYKNPIELENTTLDNIRDHDAIIISNINLESCREKFNDELLIAILEKERNLQKSEKNKFHIKYNENCYTARKFIKNILKTKPEYFETETFELKTDIATKLDDDFFCEIEKYKKLNTIKICNDDVLEKLKDYNVLDKFLEMNHNRIKSGKDSLNIQYKESIYSAENFAKNILGKNINNFIKTIELPKDSLINIDDYTNLNTIEFSENYDLKMLNNEFLIDLLDRNRIGKKSIDIKYNGRLYSVEKFIKNILKKDINDFIQTIELPADINDEFLLKVQNYKNILIPKDYDLSKLNDKFFVKILDRNRDKEPFNIKYKGKVYSAERFIKNILGKNINDLIETIELRKDSLINIDDYKNLKTIILPDITPEECREKLNSDFLVGMLRRNRDLTESLNINFKIMYQGQEYGVEQFLESVMKKSIKDFLRVVELPKDSLINIKEYGALDTIIIPKGYDLKKLSDEFFLDILDLNDDLIRCNEEPFIVIYEDQEYTVEDFLDKIMDKNIDCICSTVEQLEEVKNYKKIGTITLPDISIDECREKLNDKYVCDILNKASNIVYQGVTYYSAQAFIDRFTVHTHNDRFWSYEPLKEDNILSIIKNCKNLNTIKLNEKYDLQNLNDVVLLEILKKDRDLKEFCDADFIIVYKEKKYSAKDFIKNILKRNISIDDLSSIETVELPTEINDDFLNTIKEYKNLSMIIIPKDYNLKNLNDKVLIEFLKMNRDRLKLRAKTFYIMYGANTYIADEFIQKIMKKDIIYRANGEKIELLSEDIHKKVAQVSKVEADRSSCCVKRESRNIFDFSMTEAEFASLDKKEREELYEKIRNITKYISKARCSKSSTKIFPKKIKDDHDTSSKIELKTDAKPFKFQKKSKKSCK